MRTASLLLLLLACGMTAPARAASDAFSELPPGRYSVEVTGMLTTVCARAIQAEWKKVPEVAAAVVDFDHGSAVVTVRLDRTLQVSVLRKALKRAEKVANLGARYDLKDIKYLPQR